MDVPEPPHMHVLVCRLRIAAPPLPIAASRLVVTQVRCEQCRDQKRSSNIYGSEFKHRHMHVYFFYTS